MKKLRNERSEILESTIHEIYDIEKMFKDEGKSHGERRYAVIVAVQLVRLLDCMLRIHTMLLILLCFIIGKFLSGLL